MVVASVRTEATFGFMLVGLIIIFGPLLAQKVRLPGLIGLLIGGAIIGPNMLNVLPSFQGLESVGDIGVLYLLFLAGLGLDMKTFRRYRNVALSFGLITAIIPWALGTGVALLDGYEMKTAVLIGSFWASFTLVSYGVVTKYGLTKNASIAATVGASSITDTIGLIALALIVGSETGDQRGAVLILQIVLGLVVLAAYCMILLPRVVGWFFAGLGGDRELRFVMVLVGFLSAAVVAQLVDIEPLIGAFFAGLGLNQLVPNRSRLMARVDFFGNALFIPAFLVSVGLLVDPSVMFTGATLRIALALAAALLVGKALAAWLTGRLYDFSRAEVGLVFSLSSAQAAATLASTIIGFEIGLYGEEIVNAVMVVIVISLLVSGIGSARFGPLVVPATTSEQRLGEAVVVPLAEDKDLTNTLWLAGRISNPDGGVVIPFGVAVTDDPDSLERTRNELDGLQSTLRGLGLTGDAELRVANSVAGGVARFTLENDASLVLLDWPGPTDVRTLLLGGAIDEVASVVDRPLAMSAVARRDLERVFIAVGSSELRPGAIADVRLAVDLAVRVAEAEGLELVVGPAAPDLLVEMLGVELPPDVRHEPGSANLETWIMDQSTEADLVVIAAVDDPDGYIERLAANDRSIVAVSRSWGDQVFSSSGALGFTPPRAMGESPAAS